MSVWKATKDVTPFRRDLIQLLPKLRRFALALSGSAADAEDLVQAAVERALVNEAKWIPGSRLDSWMYKIVQNLWRDDLRSSRRKADPLDTAAELRGEDGRAVAAARADLSDVRAAMLGLPEDQRAVLVLVVLDGMSYADAAAALNMPIGTVMSRLARARAALATALEASPSSMRMARND